MKKIFARRKSFHIPHLEQKHKGQSFVELAIILPVLLLLLLGVVEVSFFIGNYLDILDLTREAARFASVRDPFVTAQIADVSCSDPEPFNFYFHTACIFSPLPSGTCPDPAFCNGLNTYMPIDPATDDVVISVYTTTRNPSNTVAGVTNTWPQPDGYWALSNNDYDTAHQNNWKMDCQGHQIRTEPFLNASTIQGDLEANKSNGFVAVEFYYCYHQVLNIPIISQIMPNPVRVHAYTVMPIPAAQPTATPKP